MSTGASRLTPRFIPRVFADDPAPHGRPIGLGTLLRPLWRQRQLHGAAGPLGVLGALGVTWGGGTLLVLLVLDYLHTVDTIGTAIAGRLLAMGLLSISSVLLLSCVVTALPSFFLSRDLELLSAAPVPPRTFFAARALQVLVEGGAVALLLVVPVFAAYGIAFGGGPLWPLVALAVWLPLWLTAMALGCIVVYLLVAFVPAARAQLVFRVGGVALSALAIVLLHRMKPAELTQLGSRAIGEVVKVLDVPLAPWLPTEWAATVLNEWLKGYWAPAPLAWLWALALATVACAYGAFRALHLRGLAAVRSAGRGDHAPSPVGAVLRLALMPFPPLRREFVLKELRLIGRDAALWSQFLLLVPLVLVYVVGVSVLPTGTGSLPAIFTSILPVVNVGLAGMVLAAVASRLVLPTIAGEGKMWTTLRAAPISTDDIVMAKWIATTAPLLLVALGIVALTSLLLATPPLVTALSLATVGALLFAQSSLALWLGAVNPRFDAESAVNQTVTWQGILFLVAAGLLTMLVALCLAPGMYWYAASVAWKTAVPWWKILRGPSVAILGCLVLTPWFLHKARRRVAALT